VYSTPEQINTEEMGIQEILDLIIKESEKLSLSEDESCYINSETG